MRPVLGFRFEQSRPVFLDPGRPEALQTMHFKQPLPRVELAAGKMIAMTRLFEGDQSTVHAGYDFSLAPRDPALGARRRQVIYGHWLASWASRFMERQARSEMVGSNWFVFSHRLNLVVSLFLLTLDQRRPP